MKVYFQRARPQVLWAPARGDCSFPSGHTMNAVVFYVALALIPWSVSGRRVGLIAVALACAIALGVGVSRIYLGFHYFADVVGGLLAGIGWLLVVGGAFRARPAWRQWQGPRAPGRDATAAPERAAPR